MSPPCGSIEEPYSAALLLRQGHVCLHQLHQPIPFQDLPRTSVPHTRLPTHLPTHLRPAANNLVEEHWSSSNMADTLANLSDMRAAGADMAAAVAAIVTAALNVRGKEVATRLPPFAEVLKAALAAPAPAPLAASELAEGLLQLARTLHVLAEDMPKVRACVGREVWVRVCGKGAGGETSTCSHRPGEMS